jgi:hypothetical protein
MNSNSNYETLYGVGFLDDLHNYFPALLYDSSSFGNVQSVLAYIQRQTRTRFDLFSYGLREYQGRQPPPVPPSSVENSSRRIVRTSFSSVASQGLPSLSTLRSSIAPTLGTEDSQTNLFNQTIPNLRVEIQRNIQENEEDDEEEEEETVQAGQADTYIANALLSLLNLPVTSLTRNYVLPNLNNGRVTMEQMMGRPTMDQFLQPVVVRPTPEQIDANTTVGNLVSDTEHTCAICQDALTSEQEGRKLNACGHWFHRACIDTWLQGNVHCPVCRHDIREPLRQEE